MRGVTKVLVHWDGEQGRSTAPFDDVLSFEKLEPERSGHTSRAFGKFCEQWTLPSLQPAMQLRFWKVSLEGRKPSMQSVTDTVSHLLTDRQGCNNFILFTFIASQGSFSSQSQTTFASLSFRTRRRVCTSALITLWFTQLSSLTSALSI